MSNPGNGKPWQKLLLSRRWLFFPPLLLGVLVFVLIVTRDKDLPKNEISEQVSSVPVVKVHSEMVALQATGYGTVEPRRRWTAVAEVAGKLQQRHAQFAPGQQVEAGWTLFEIDPEDYRLQQKQREADVRSAQAQLDELWSNMAAELDALEVEQALYFVQQADVRRAKSLQKQSALSVNELEAARSSLLRQEQSVQTRLSNLALLPARIQAAEASLATAMARLREAQRNVEKTRIIAPFSGRITDNQLEDGQFVGVGQALFEIQDAVVVEIDAQFRLGQLNQIVGNSSGSLPIETSSTLPIDDSLLGQIDAMVIVHDRDRDWIFKGKPTRIAEQLDPQTRTLAVTVEVSNILKTEGENYDTLVAASEAQGADLPRVFDLTPGEFCEVVLSGPKRPAFRIPRTAIYDNTVYVVDPQTKRLKPVRIELGPVQGRQQVVTGLEDGQWLVTQIQLPVIGDALVEPVFMDGSDANNPQTGDEVPRRGTE